MISMALILLPKDIQAVQFTHSKVKSTRPCLIFLSFILSLWTGLLSSYPSLIYLFLISWSSCPLSASLDPSVSLSKAKLLYHVLLQFPYLHLHVFHSLHCLETIDFTFFCSPTSVTHCAPLIFDTQAAFIFLFDKSLHTLTSSIHLKSFPLVYL